MFSGTVLFPKIKGGGGIPPPFLFYYKAMVKLADITGIILAGGQSRRMGRDKRFLELEGRTLLERGLAVLETLFPEVLIVAAEDGPAFAALRHRVVTDLIPGCATLGGLLTGLSLASRPRVFAAACDMPFLAPAVILRMVELGGSADVVMAKLGTGLQPMHALYAKSCLPHLERMARTGNLKVQDLCQTPGLKVRVVTEEELRETDPRLLSFMNLNTPADLELARKLVAGRKEPSAEGR